MLIPRLDVVTAVLDTPRTPATRVTRRVLGELDRPGDVFAHITPNWFTTVMGTGLLAVAAADLPVHVPGLHVAATALWLLATAALVGLSLAFAVHWSRHRARARAYAVHPVMSQFYGAPPMALLTVGAGSVLLGPALLGDRLAVGAGAALWTVGTLLGLTTAVVLPYRMITVTHREVVAVPALLIPIVPPMVSASTASLLVSHLPPGQPRLTMLAGAYTMFGLSLVVGMITMTMIWSRLIHHGMPDLHAAPTVWITLGVIGQSITAANLLGVRASSAFPPGHAADATVLRGVGIVYGLTMAGFAALLFTVATLLTVRAMRHGLPFSLSWWSVTFPVGACVTGATALGDSSGIVVVHAVAIGLFVALTLAWTTVAAATLRGTVSGRLFLPT